MDNSYSWLVKLALVQIIYLAIVLWGMRHLQQRWVARLWPSRLPRRSFAASRPPSAAPQKS